MAEPGVSTCPLAGRGIRPAGRPWSRTGTGAAFSATAGTRAFARPRRAPVPLAAPPAARDAAADADAAAAAAIAAAARSDAWRPRQTRAERTIRSFSASGVSLTQVRGSVR
jgi:ribosomal protein S11